MKKIAFHSNQLGLRGTEVALYDYARYNEELLKNKSYIIFNKKNNSNSKSVIKKFKDKFDVISYESVNDIDHIVRETGIELLYAIKAGHFDGVLSSLVQNAIHAVFPAALNEIHGNKYAYVSDWLSETFSNNLIPSVPHIVNAPLLLTNTLHKELGIPDKATIFGCHGGENSFDIQFVKDGIAEVVNERNDIYFIFLNIQRFINHSQVFFLPGDSDIGRKESFINTCDAMLHARLIGETFGLACAEFSVRNKPVITYELSPQRMHLMALGDRAICYKNKRELIKILYKFDKTKCNLIQWDVYSEKYSPSKVMKKFNDIFIQPTSMNNIDIGIGDIFPIFLRKFEYKTQVANIKLLKLLKKT